MTMNNQRNPANFFEWIAVARKDRTRLHLMLKNGDFEAAGFFLQQTLEKYLKAFLLKNGWKLRKIHELDALLDHAVKYKTRLQNFYDLCERVSGYYFTNRYPPLSLSGLTGEDIKKDIKGAQKLIKALFPREK